MGTQDFQGAVGVALGHEGGEAAFAGDLQGVEAENLTGGMDVFADGDEPFLDVQGEIGGFGDFVEDAG